VSVAGGKRPKEVHRAMSGKNHGGKRGDGRKKIPCTASQRKLIRSSASGVIFIVKNTKHPPQKKSFCTSAKWKYQDETIAFSEKKS